MIKTDVQRFVLRVARETRKAIAAEDRFQPKLTIRQNVEGAWDSVNEYMQGG
jgi:hypothetical protein